MIAKAEVVKNVGSSWFSLGVSALVGVFLSPYSPHRRDTAYGIWVLIFSITGYYGLFDLGIRSSTYTATGDHEGLAQVMSTSLVTAIGMVTMIVTLACSLFVDRLFRIPSKFLTTARRLFLMVGAAVAIGFPTDSLAESSRACSAFIL